MFYSQMYRRSKTEKIKLDHTPLPLKNWYVSDPCNMKLLATSYRHPVYVCQQDWSTWMSRDNLAFQRYCRECLMSTILLKILSLYYLLTVFALLKFRKTTRNIAPNAWIPLNCCGCIAWQSIDYCKENECWSFSCYESFQVVDPIIETTRPPKGQEEASGIEPSNNSVRASWFVSGFLSFFSYMFFLD